MSLKSISGSMGKRDKRCNNQTQTLVFLLFMVEMLTIFSALVIELIYNYSADSSDDFSFSFNDFMSAL